MSNVDPNPNLTLDPSPNLFQHFSRFPLWILFQGVRSAGLPSGPVGHCSLGISSGSSLY